MLHLARCRNVAMIFRIFTTDTPGCSRSGNHKQWPGMPPGPDRPCPHYTPDRHLALSTRPRKPSLARRRAICTCYTGALCRRPALRCHQGASGRSTSSKALKVSMLGRPVRAQRPPQDDLQGLVSLVGVARDGHPPDEGVGVSRFRGYP